MEDLQRANSHLLKLANVDPLTGLLNRRGLEAALDAANRHVERSGGGLAAVLIDCDDFKAVNDDFGHDVGDSVLEKISERICGAARTEDHIARVGGDEILLLLVDVRMAEAMEIAERIRLAICTDPVLRGEKDVHVTASLGVQDVSDRRDSIGDILAHTRLALKNSKIGKNRVRGGDGDTPALDATKALLDGDVWTAVQPIYQLETEAVCGYEMLSRGPDGPFSRPRDFFRVCRELDVLAAVDARCLEVSLRAAASLPQERRIHMNVFPATLIEHGVDRILEIIDRVALPHQVCLELSEQYFVGDPSRLRAAVTELRKAGISIALENVGFGRSALETLVVLEPDYVKIDRRYIQSGRADTGQRFLERILNVVRVLGSTPMAEGIETAADLALARDVGISLGQGYLLARPASI